jgi:uncharacterized protein YecE (DUF72 family)
MSWATSVTVTKRASLKLFWATLVGLYRPTQAATTRTSYGWHNPRVAGTLYLGTSGFAYQEWKGPFYPEDLKDREMLAFYAGRFRSVEINYTFRRSPSPKTIATWEERTPDGFRFSLKAHQHITHTLRLADADEAVTAFLDRVRGLGDRLGPILFQCPPSLRFDRALIERFVGYLPPTFRSAMEFRHPSWEEARGILADQGVAWCVAETDERAAGDPSWEPFGYLRLRKESYSDEELAAWAGHIKGGLEAGNDVYCYLKHEEKASGAQYAERLGELLA